jgi:excisionase family DNA binding protein
MSKLPKPPIVPKFHSIKTIASRLDLSPRSVQRLISCGALQAVKIGGAVRVSDDELLRLLLASRVVSTPDD